MTKLNKHLAQRGAAHLALVMLLIVVVGVVAAGYYVMKHRNQTSSSTSSSVSSEQKLPTSSKLVQPNGTVTQLSKQVDLSDADETKSEDQALSAEDAATSIDQKSVDNVKGGADASSL